MEPFSNIRPKETDSLSSAELIDVRTKSEFDEGHITGSVLIPIGTPEFQDRLAALDKDKPYIVYCRSGHRSGIAMMHMKNMGFREVYNLAGGIIAWRASGKGLVR